MDVSIPGGALAITVALIAVGIFAFIVIMRNIYAKRAETGLGQSEQGSSLASRAKYPGADVFQYSGTFFNLGLALSLALTVLAFGWTQYDAEIYIPDDALELPDEIEVEPPRTAEPPPPPPPPPPPIIEEVPDEEILEDEEVTFEDQSIDQSTIVEAPVADAPPPPPPPPPPPEPKVEEIFKVVEDMPRFPGCEDLPSKEERKQCADKKMLEFIYKNIKYPAIARENGVEGVAVIQFVVEKDGSITDAKVVRDPGAQTGSEALRVVELMGNQHQWIPGKQRGRNVRVQFNLPVKFRLE